MFDARRSYDPDVVVEPSRPRAVTGELTMQILHGGQWHRRTPDLKSTACGESYHAQFAPVRRESYAGRLCTDCFTLYEHAQSAQLTKSDKEGTR